MSRFSTAFEKAWVEESRRIGRDLSTDESDACEAHLFDAWIEAGRFAELVSHLQESYDTEGGYTEIVCFAQALRQRGQVVHVHDLFRGLIATREKAFWQHWPGAEAGNLGHMRAAAKYFASCMEAMLEYHHNLWSLGLAQEQAALKDAMLRFQARVPPPPKPRAPARKLTEAGFWREIDAARQGAGSASLFASRLAEALATRGPDAIHAFDAMLTRKLDELRAWDLWAFAHIARGGCSDDAFDYFRAWIVAGGKARFKAALDGPDDLLDHCDDSWDLQCEELLGTAAEACRLCPGAAHAPAPSTPRPMQGRPFTEDELPTRLPAVYARYA